MNVAVAHRRVNIIQGEFHVSTDSDVVLTTILGSCIAACIRDPIAGVGGMNHFLLPGSAEAILAGGDATRFGVHLMELLINGLLKNGASKGRMEAKIFGGAKTINSSSNVGEKNAAFAQKFLRDEGIRILGSSTGGEHGRKLEYWPIAGRARQHALTGAETKRTVAMEQRVTPARAPKPAADTSIEFF